MKVEIVAKNYEVPKKLGELIEKKVQRFDKYLTGELRCKAYCRAEKELLSLELTLTCSKDTFRAEVHSFDMYENLDEVLKKIERQIVKKIERHNHKNKKGQRQRIEPLFNEEIEEREPPKLVRTKRYELKPISVDDAIGEFEALDHEFYVFLNESTKQINVLYRRKDGNYGIIEAGI